MKIVLAVFIPFYLHMAVDIVLLFLTEAFLLFIFHTIH